MFGSDPISLFFTIRKEGSNTCNTSITFLGEILKISSFVTVVELLMSAYFPALHAALGIYIPLIVVNCIILGRAEAFASRNTVGQSVLDALGMGLGFTWALLALGLIREILGAGSAFGFSFVGEDAYPVLLFIMPPGAFLALAGLIVVFNWLRRK